VKCWHCLLNVSFELARDAITVADGNALCRQHLQEYVAQQSRERRPAGWPERSPMGGKARPVTGEEMHRALGQEDAADRICQRLAEVPVPVPDRLEPLRRRPRREGSG
jgi:hypothetical protein